MRAATIASIAVLGLSTAAIAGVGFDGQRHHRGSSAMSNSTDMNSMSMNSSTTPDSMAPGSAMPSGTMSNGM